jgi:probable HAF family extracellular repeat protein
VNAQGLVTGYVTHNPFLSGVPTDLRPFIFDAVGGGVTLLDPLPGDEAAVGRGINDNGHVVGSSGNHMVLYRPAPENLGPGDAAAINKADQVAGSKVFGSGPRRACRIDASAASPVAEDLGHSPVPGYDGSRAYGINDDGVVVGESFSPSLPSRAFVYFPDGPDAGFHDLQPLLVNGDGWELDVAFDISNYGTIVGYGRHYGDMRGFQLEPTSPPSGGLDKKFVRIPDELLAFIFLFGGVEHGAGGSGVLPHGKPVPIPPHGLRDLWASLTPARRDLALGLAIQRLQSLISDPTQADRVGRVSEGLIEAASAQLRQIAADRRAGPIV